MEPVVSGNGDCEIYNTRRAVGVNSTTLSVTPDAGNSVRRSLILINVDEITGVTSPETRRSPSEEVKCPGTNSGADTVRPHHYNHHNQQQRQYPPWDSLRAQSLSRLETFVSTGGGGGGGGSSAAGGRRCCHDDVDDNYDDCKVNVDDLCAPTATCPGSGGRRRVDCRLKCPSFPHLMEATIRSGSATATTSSEFGACENHLNGAVSFIECDSVSCCCCNCCCYCGGSADVDASSMSPRLSSNVDLSQDLDTDIQFSRSTAAAGQRERSRMMTSASALVESKSSLLGRSVSVRAVTDAGAESADVDTVDVETPSSSPSSGDVTSDKAQQNVVTVLSNNIAVVSGINNATSRPKISPPKFPASWKMRRSTSCPSMMTTTSVCIPLSLQCVSGFDHSLAIVQPEEKPLTSDALLRRRSHVHAVDINLEGEVVADLPVAVRPNIIYPDFNPEMDGMLTMPVTATNMIQQSMAAYSACTAATSRPVRSAHASSSPEPTQGPVNCVRQRRQTMATSGDVRIKCLQWLNGLATDNNNLTQF